MKGVELYGRVRYAVQIEELSHRGYDRTHMGERSASPAAGHLAEHLGEGRPADPGTQHGMSFNVTSELSHETGVLGKGLTRSAKSSAAHPQLISDADNDGSRPSFLDLDVFSTRQNNNGDEHKVASADAVFGRESLVVPLPETSQLSTAPVGRVLPSFIGDDDLLPVRLTDGDGKSRRGRNAGKVKSSLPIRRKQPTFRPKSELASDFLEQPAASLSADILIVSMPLRKRRPI